MDKRELKPPVWSEGMFLTPHHLQYFHRHLASVAWAQGRGSAPYAWGFRHLVLDEQALANHSFKALELNAILPDGCYIALPGNLDMPSRDFKDHLPGDDGPLMVYLGVPDFKPDERNLQGDAPEAGGGLPCRYRKESVQLCDSDTGEMPRSIEVARFQGRIFFAGEDREGFICLPLARLKRSRETDRFALDPDYAPPLLSLEAWPPLLNLVQDIASRAMNTRGTLAKSFSGRAFSEALSRPQGLESSLKMLALGGNALVIRQSCALPDFPPAFMYLELLRLAGDLELFAGADQVAPPPAYDHENIAGCFIAARNCLFALLDKLAAPAYARREFVMRHSHLEVDLEQDWVSGQRQLYIRISGGEDPESMTRQAAGLKLCAPSDLETVIQRRLGAIPVSWLRVPPSSLPSGEGVLFGQISQGGSFWPSVLTDLNLVLGGVEGLPYSFDLFVV